MSPATYLLLALALCTAFGIVAFLIPRDPPGAVMPEATRSATSSSRSWAHCALVSVVRVSVGLIAIYASAPMLRRAFTTCPSV